MCAVLLTYTKKLSNLTFPWEKILHCYHLFTFLFQPASIIHGFFACSFLFYLRPFCETLIHWQGNQLSLICMVASTYGLFPLVKHLALNQEHKSSDKILQGKTGFAAAAVNLCNVCPVNIAQFEEYFSKRIFWSPYVLRHGYLGATVHLQHESSPPIWAP